VPQDLKAKWIKEGSFIVDRCSKCHGETGAEPDDDETPRLDGQWAKYMELQLMAYRDKDVKLPHEKMRKTTMKLAEEEVGYLNHYFASAPKRPARRKKKRKKRRKKPRQKRRSESRDTDMTTIIVAISSSFSPRHPRLRPHGPTTARGAAAAKRVVVVGGGFGGATAAKYIARMDPKIKVTLIEANKAYVSCPLSNEVISGHRAIETCRPATTARQARHRDPDRPGDGHRPGQEVRHHEGRQDLNYDALVVAPGVELNYGQSRAIPNGGRRDPARLQGRRADPDLKKQLEAMPTAACS